MNWFTGTAVFVLVWFLVFLVALPWGVRLADAPESGHEAGAPANPRIGLKILLTTIIACVIWVGVEYIVANDIIDFRPPDTSDSP